MIVPIFLPHAGCHERCIYCNQDDITHRDNQDLQSYIDKMLSSSPGAFEVGVYGGNLFGMDLDELKDLFRYLERYRAKIAALRVSTKPVNVNRGLMDLLKDAGVTTVELGVPVFNDEILKALNRRHSVEDLYNAFYALKESGFSVALQVMVGLPRETFADIVYSAGHIERLQPAYLRVYPLAVIDGTPLAEMYREGGFTPIPFEEGVDRTLYLYLRSLRAGIAVAKMGLTANEILTEKVIAGLYHPAFGFLVKARAFLKAILHKTAAASMRGKVVVTVNRRDVPHLLGHRREHIMFFQERDITITWNTEERACGTFLISCGDTKTEGTVFDALTTFPS